MCQWTWVAAPTVYCGQTELLQPLSTKELGQLLDLREDWQSAAKFIWDKFGGTASDPFPACRVATEVRVRKFEWWRTPPEQYELDSPPINWDVSRSFLNVAREGALKISSLSLLLYEPFDAVEVTTAVKADSAGVDVALWDVGGQSPIDMRATRAVLRRIAYQWWYIRIEMEAFAWLNSEKVIGRPQEDLDKSLDVILDCLRRARRANWFEWLDGSRPFFWRCPESHRREALDKGGIDIRVVWSDETETGVNPSVFAPNFFLPNADTCARRMPNDAYIGDFDVGEMFYDFPLHEGDQPYHCTSRFRKS
eukprot:scaffold305_cov60-Attheya_sp.AAC.3